MLNLDTALGRILTLKTSVEQLYWLCQQPDMCLEDLNLAEDLSRPLIEEINAVNRRLGRRIVAAEMEVNPQ